VAIIKGNVRPGISAVKQGADELVVKLMPRFFGIKMPKYSYAKQSKINTIKICTGGIIFRMQKQN